MGEIPGKGSRPYWNGTPGSIGLCPPELTLHTLKSPGKDKDAGEETKEPPFVMTYCDSIANWNSLIVQDTNPRHQRGAERTRPDVHDAPQVGQAADEAGHPEHGRGSDHDARTASQR